MVLCDCICISSVIRQLMCATTDLCVIYVWTTMLIVIMSLKYLNRTHVSCIATEINATELVMYIV